MDTKDTEQHQEHDHDAAGCDHVAVDLPCDCTDVHWSCGVVDLEHDHVLCEADTRLWAVHVAGPDDVLAMPNRLVAEAWAHRVNEAVRVFRERDPSPLNPPVTAEVVPWAGSADEHQRAVDWARAYEAEQVEDPKSRLLSDPLLSEPRPS